MTVFIDPVIGAALVAGLLPILPALPCPTCGGRSEFRDDMFGSSPCPDCTDGVWTPTGGPVPIGVTSAEPQGSYGDWDVYFDHISYSLGSEDADDNLVMHPIVLSSMIGEGTLRKVKVHDWDHEPEDDPGIWLEGRPGHIIGLVLQDDSLAETDISSALPFLPGLKPEDTVYLLDGFTESVECPEWHDSTPEDVINEVERRLRDEEWSSQASDRCRTALLHIDAYREGKARSQSVGRLSCPFPVDAPDHPCVLEAT